MYRPFLPHPNFYSTRNSQTRRIYRPNPTVPSLRSLPRSPYLDAIHEAERLETAHRATGIPITSSQNANFNLNERNPSPPTLRHSRPVLSENNVFTEKHNPVPSFLTDPSSQRVLNRFADTVQFKPDANTLHIYEKNAPIPIEHEPNLSLQPNKSSLKSRWFEFGNRSPRPASNRSHSASTRLYLPLR